MKVNLFAYGTLQYPALAEAVTGVAAEPEPATLHGFRREGMRGRAYPAIMADPGARVAGQLYRGLPARVLVALDRFEGDEYVREQHRVAIPDGRWLPVWCYVVAPSCAGLLSGRAWDTEAFERLHLARYVGGEPPAGCRDSRRSDAP